MTSELAVWAPLELADGRRLQPLGLQPNRGNDEPSAWSDGLLGVLLYPDGTVTCWHRERPPSVHDVEQACRALGRRFVAQVYSRSDDLVQPLAVHVATEALS